MGGKTGSLIGFRFLFALFFRLEGPLKFQENNFLPRPPNKKIVIQGGCMTGKAGIVNFGVFLKGGPVYF